MTQTYESNIWSEDEALRFYNGIVGERPAEESETDFICLAARKKYMTDGQRAECSLGDTCMMGKTILKEHDEAKFLSVLHRLDAQLDWFTDLRGNMIPRSCFAFYMNINHTLVPKAVADFKKELAEYDMEIACALANHGKSGPATVKMKNVENRLKKAFQNPSNQTDGWIDIDMDIEKTGGDEGTKIRALVAGLEQADLDGNAIECLMRGIRVIETRGGYHVLVGRTALKSVNSTLAKSLPASKIKDHVLTADRIARELEAHYTQHGVAVKEIGINQNRMVPVPGTMQGGFEVRLA